MVGWRACGRSTSRSITFAARLGWAGGLAWRALGPLRADQPKRAARVLATAPSQPPEDAGMGHASYREKIGGDSSARKLEPA